TYRIRALRTRRALLSLMAIGFLASLALSIHGVARHPSYAFYLPPTRAWELLLGSIVAFAPPPARLAGRPRVRDLASAAGLAMIVVPAFAYTPRTPFPGLAALPPCLGTALLIWSNGRGEGGAPTLVGRVLSWRPVVFVGLISYSLYLWHWPL